MCTKLNTTGGNITNIIRNNEASVISGITSVNSTNTDRGLSVDNKKGKRMKYIKVHIGTTQMNMRLQD